MITYQELFLVTYNHIIVYRFFVLGILDAI